MSRTAPESLGKPGGVLTRRGLPRTHGGWSWSHRPIPPRPLIPNAATPLSRPPRPPLPVDPARRPVAQRLVRPLLVVKREVPVQPLGQLRHRLVAAQVNVLVLHRPPQ